MKKIKIRHVLITMLLIVSVAARAQYGPPWVKTNVGFNYILTGIDFPGNQDLVGYIAGESLTYNGNGIVLKTTDGGNTWISKWTGTNMGLEGSCFVDVNTGFVAGWPNQANGWSGFGKTTDGGTTWTSPVVVPDVYYFTDVVFKDANNGILIGSTNTAPGVYVTSNAGVSWTVGTGASNGVPYSACYVSGNTYFLVDNGGRIKKSADNGLTWTTVYTLPGALLTGIDFYDDNIGMACGDNGLIVTTSDGGITWQYQLVGTDIWRDFGWQNQNHVFCAGTPEIVAESIDAGVSWGNGFSGSSYQAALYECIFTNNGSGFICGSQGTLLKRLPSCTAGFSANQTGICTGESVSFINQSIGTISTYDWYFEGGNPSASSNSDPVVTYDNPGVFDVRLIVNNGYWSDTLLYANYITVTQPVTPVISLNGTLLSSNINAGNQWYRDGLLIQGATGPTYQASLSGWYWDVVTQSGCSSDPSNQLYVLMTGLPDPEALKFNVIQVPGTGRIRISMGSACNSSNIMVFNSMGVKIIEKTVMSVNETRDVDVDLGIISTGIYVIRMQTESSHFIRKILLKD